MIQDIQPHKLYNQYETNRTPGEDDPVFAFDDTGGSMLVLETDGRYDLPSVHVLKDLLGGDQLPSLTYLFRVDERRFFLADRSWAEVMEAVRHLTPARGQALPVYLPLRALRQQAARGDKTLSFASYTAYQLSEWYRDNRYCGRCSGEMAQAGEERALVCGSCGHRVYPRINPAVIVGVTDHDKILMTKYADRPLSSYALVAGFTEIGETLEETVAREVMEETGLKVKNIRYYKSQPWGIADDILAGFFCDVDGDTTIRLDETELKEGTWFSREDVAGQPDDFSLTNEMMMLFKAGKEPR